ncbi:CDP-glucose 4,6-dehydratase [Sphingomonas oligophenolica]|uniref:CDP-glucose 4,6-dehydratase n=1 Tax=Sphingomonas oligophenolica TaxID=301154 RepID=A0ABU9YC06_9SPHN
MLVVDPAFWSERRVFVTGHTGFKGAWLTFWLRRMGAGVTGYALPPCTTPTLFGLLGLPQDHFADICDTAALDAAIRAARPEIVLHLAAQALVRPSFDDPVGTFAANVVGTAALLDSVRRTDGVRAVIIVTSDKCYENREWAWGYREVDRLGGHDPYSASKGAAEIVTASMRQSYFAPYKARGHPARIASVRAGNVIGGGDWSTDRLVPGIVRSILTGDGSVTLRKPGAVRPWQHVLDPVAAYLGLAQRLYEGDAGTDEAFNFGPADDDARQVVEVAEAMIAAFGQGHILIDSPPDQPHEANLLRLDCSKAVAQLCWHPRWNFADAAMNTASWYAQHAKGEDVTAITTAQIDAFQAASPYGEAA